MLTLNLVSEQLKKEIKSRHIFNLVKKLNYILIIIAIIIAIILLTSKIILQINFTKVVNQTTLVNSYSSVYTKKVRQINSQLNTITQIQNNYVEWSKLFKIISDIVPEGIRFTSLKIDNDGAIIKIRGFAETRDSLVDLKDRFKKSDIFSDIKSPIQDILKKDDINFTIDMKFDLKNIPSDL